MKRFRWTRAKYRRAQHLARLLPRVNYSQSDAPDIVQRYFTLWERYPSYGDPLLTPMRYRYELDDIPF